MRKIKLVNKISPNGLEILENAGYTCAEDIAAPDGIMVRSADMHSAKLPESVLAIARAGAGTNNIPVEQCSKDGIAVFNTPGGNANAVKELTIMGLLLSCRKSVPSIQWVQSLKGKGDEVPGLVEKGKSQFTGPELKGKRLGVIGLGAIGTMVCNTARHFGMEVYGYDPYLSVEAAWGLSRDIRHAKTLKEIYQNCDFISLHLPVTAETRGMINAAAFAQMKPLVRILNFSRGELVNDTDMLKALDERQVYCYVTDFPNDALLGHPGIISLPHLGASTPESEDNCAEMAALQLKDYLDTGNIKNSVNLPNVQVARSSRARVTVIHENRPTMISQITGAVGENINNCINNSRGDLGYMIIDIDGAVTPDMLARITAIAGVIRVREIA
jgi:D-3-phosphoglycerate dehydrogenase